MKVHQQDGGEEAEDEYSNSSRWLPVPVLAILASTRTSTKYNLALVRMHLQIYV